MRPDILKLPKITNLLFHCNILTANWVMKLMFSMLVSMKACYKLIVCRWSRIPKVPKMASLLSLWYLKKELKVEVDFFPCRVSKTFISTLWASKLPNVDIIIINGHDQVFSNYSNKFAISLQYLKKEIRNGDHFGMQINMNVSTRWYYPLWWK